MNEKDLITKPLSTECEDCKNTFALEVEPDGSIVLFRCEQCQTNLLVSDPKIRHKLRDDLIRIGAKRIQKRKPNFWEIIFGAKNLDV